jgi:tight adherence protein B
MNYSLLSVMAVVAVAMAISLGSAVFFRMRAVSAKTSAMMMSRVVTIGNDAQDDLAMQRVPPKRIAHNATVRKLFLGGPFVADIAGLLSESGSQKTVAEFSAYTLGSAVAVATTCAILGFRTPAALFVGFFSATLPWFYFMQARMKRIAAFEAQLPQALELLTLYLRSGRSLPQAFVATTEELTAPASEEFAVCAEAYRLGRPLPQALRVLANKYRDSVGLKLFSIAVSVMGQTGGNLVEVIDRIRKSMEASMIYTLKLRAMTGESRTSAIVLGIVPGAFMAASALIMPEYFNQFFESFVGYVTFAFFCFIWIAGLVWIKILMGSRA